MNEAAQASALAGFRSSRHCTFNSTKGNDRNSLKKTVCGNTVIKSSGKATVGDRGRPPPGGDPELGSDGEKGAGGKECQAEGTGCSRARGRNKPACLRNRKEASVARGV